MKKRLIARGGGDDDRHAEELTELDQAIGDGDHGLNMKRGFEAVLADADNLAGKPLREMLKAAGMHLVMNVGGASGPLYGTLLHGAGQGRGRQPADIAGVARIFAEAVEAVPSARQVGRRREDHARRAAAGGRRLSAAAPAESAADLAAALAPSPISGLEATRPMQATKGRASFLGERSIGHIDPGARSSQLLLHAVCDVLVARHQAEKAGAA